MLTTSQALNIADDLVSRTRRFGADACDVVYSGDASTDVQVRLGELEDVTRAEGEEVSLRVFIGQRSASSATSDLSSRALDTLAERVVAMAREVPDDEYAGLAPQDMLLRTVPPVLDLDDGSEVPPAALKARALEAEEAARAVPGVTNSEGGSASTGCGVMALVTSHGFAGGYTSSSHAVSASVLAGTGADMQRDYSYHHVRHLSDLDAAYVVGRKAGERAIARLGASQMRSGPMPMIFDPRVGGSLLGHLIGAINGAAIARKTSFLIDAMGTRIFGQGVTINDVPHRLRGLRSRPFDGEGLPTAETSIVKNGILTTWLIDAAAARQLGEKPTGHSTRGGAGASNLHLAAGAVSPTDLMADIKCGFYVTELIGMGVNGLTGDYSRGASGFLIENGARARAVNEVTLAGNLKDMFAALVPANDLTFRYATNVPTLRIDGMTLAGA
jgi:PmbA protein